MQEETLEITYSNFEFYMDRMLEMLLEAPRYNRRDAPKCNFPSHIFNKKSRKPTTRLKGSKEFCC